MTTPYTYVADLAATVQIPENGTLSRTVYADGHIRVVLFGFDAGQELTEHTAARPALIQILQGEARLTLGGDTVDARPGGWIRMDANLPHTVLAVTPMLMLLTLLPAD